MAEVNNKNSNNLDVGYTVINYAAPGSKSVQLKGKGDGQVQNQEKIDHLIEQLDANSNNYEAAKKFKEMLGIDYSVSLDDFDPTTQEDEKLRKQVDQAIKVLKANLAELNISRQGNPDDYEKLLAIGLFYFVDTPQTVSEGKVSHFNDRTRELKDLGLEKFQNYLKTHGGLGSEEWLSIKDVQESSALEAIKKQSGKCTERFKVLYAVFKRAGLNPFPVLVKPRDFEQAHEKATGISRNVDNMLHMIIGIKVSQGDYLFDLDGIEEFQSRAKYENYYVLGLRNYFSMELKNYQSQAFHLDKTFYLEKALEIDPENPYLYIELSYYSIKTGIRETNPEKKRELFEIAKEASQKAVELNPTNDAAYVQLGAAAYHLGEFKFAQKAFEDAVKINPKQREGHQNLSVLFHKQGNRALAIYHARVLAALNPDKLDHLSSMVLTPPKSKDPDQALEEMKTESFEKDLRKKIASHKSDSVKSYDLYRLAYILCERGPEEYESALKAIQLNPDEPVFYYMKTMLFQKMDRFDEARQTQEKAKELAKKFKTK